MRWRGSPASERPSNRMSPGIGAVDAADAVEQRGLAGAVRPDQAADLAAPDIEGHAVHRDDAAKTHHNAEYAQQRVRLTLGLRRGTTERRILHQQLRHGSSVVDRRSAARPLRLVMRPPSQSAVPCGTSVGAGRDSPALASSYYPGMSRKRRRDCQANRVRDRAARGGRSSHPMPAAGSASVVGR